MPLLLKNNSYATDDWVHLSDDDALSQPATVSMKRFGGTEDVRDTIKGVRIAPDDNPLDLVDFLVQLELLVIEFPAFTDGRGYSHARTLRQQLNYTGEIRATGDIRAEQIAFMRRCGIDTFELKSEFDTDQLLLMSQPYPHSYQPSYMQ